MEPLSPSPPPPPASKSPTSSLSLSSSSSSSSSSTPSPSPLMKIVVGGSSRRGGRRRCPQNYSRPSREGGSGLASRVKRVADEEATALVGLAKTSQESRCGKLSFAVKSQRKAHHHGMLPNQTSHHAAAVAVAVTVRPSSSNYHSDLLGCLSEFLASRNVINQTERYEKISDSTAPLQRPGRVAAAVAERWRRRPRARATRDETMRHEQTSTSSSSSASSSWSGCFECPSLQQKWRPSTAAPVSNSSDQARRIREGTTAVRGAPFPFCETAARLRLPAEQQVKKFEQCGCNRGTDQWSRRATTTSGKLGIGRLLADLLSGRHGNRLIPLLKLLRAPIVLAAMFSLALAISLFTLYTLSWHHCQTRIGGGVSAGGAGLIGLGDTTKPFRQRTNNIGSSTSAQVREPMLTSNNSEITGGSAGTMAVAPSTTISSSTTNNNDDTTSSGSPVTVHTECGPYEGRPEGRALKFRGVAYASPPVGPRRWQKPHPIWLDKELCSRGSNWAEQAAREHCVQLSPFNHRVSGSEDCLYLDIYTPARFGLNKSDGNGQQGASSAQRLPVMVYIHGGFLVFGSNGAEQRSSGGGGGGGGRQVNWMNARPSGQLASELNVVLVAPNYRLQALGFMALKQLALDNGPDGSEGNYGLWDQLIALQWIRRNIDSFGGDPNRVLVFGPDAASALPLALMSRKRRRAAAAATAPDDLEGQPAQREEQNEGRPRHNQSDDNPDGLSGTVGESVALPSAIQPPEPSKQASWQTSSTGTLKSEAPCREKNNSDDDYEQLFHSVWLMNPTIYYELSYELANQHYSRLIRSQSVCSSDLDEASDSAGASLEREPPPLLSPQLPTVATGHQNHTSRYAARLVEWRETSDRLRKQTGQGGSGNGSSVPLTGSIPATTTTSTSERLLNCLMGLSGEQIVREYLGRDDAAFRLDDENSLPIRNIFPDQFVTIDGQLVRDSFPYLDERAAGYSKLRSNLAEAGSADSGDAMVGRPTKPTKRPADDERRSGPERGQISMIIGSTAQAVEFWPCPRNLADWSWSDFRHYVTTSLNSFNQADDTFKRASELYRVPPVDCSNKQSANYYNYNYYDHCKEAPNSTNSAAGEAWNISSSSGDGGGDPMGAYLTMVSDIRQACPARELSESLRLGGRVASMERYIVEWRPSSQLSRSLALAGAGSFSRSTSDNGSNGLHHQQQPKYAFHYWDLLALFGFEFESQPLEPEQSDLEFQRHIRSMARRAAWSVKHNHGSSSPSSSASQSDQTSDRFEGELSVEVVSLSEQEKEQHASQTRQEIVADSKLERAKDNGDDEEKQEEEQRKQHEQELTQEAVTIPNERFSIFTLDHQVKSGDKLYKRRECKLWQHSLKQSYAWIS